jgi:hypothetical protein
VSVVTWSAAGVPSLNTITGTSLATKYIGQGVYRFEFQTTSVTAANSHSIEWTPADNGAADTGNVYAGGFQAEDAPFPSSYIKTTTATVTRAADALSVTFGHNATDTETWYARIARPVWADASGSITISPYVFRIGTASPTTVTVSPYLLYQAAARTVEAGIDSSSTDRTATASVASGTQTIAAKFASLTTGGTVTLDVGAGYGSASAAATAGDAFSAQTLYIGTSSAAGNELFGVLLDLVAARGAISMQGMQGKA